MTKPFDVVRENQACQQRHAVRYLELRDKTDEDLLWLAHHHLNKCALRLRCGSEGPFSRYDRKVGELERQPSAEARAAVHDSLVGVFASFTVMDRVGPGVAALRQVNDGRLPNFFAVRMESIWALLTEVEGVRRCVMAMPAANRLRLSLDPLVGSQDQKLRTVTLEMAVEASRLAGLPEFSGLRDE